jgi:hypothetical protein
MVIDIGSGLWPRADADICMDLHPWPKVNCQHNLLVTPYPFDNENFEVDKVLTEINRILKVGAIFEVIVPDFRWIAERIIKNDWFTQANVDWLNPTTDSWSNAMSYWFGGFHNKNEYNLKGMGHVNGFDFNSLKILLEKNGFINIQRIPDIRNPEPARNAILRIVCTKR